jgi:hypothetical protein
VPLRIYTPSDFERLRSFASKLEGHSGLGHQPFVDHYYAGSEWCRLFLFEEPSGEITGTLGLDLMRFEARSREWTLGFGSNFNAAKPGVGGLLYLTWMKSCPSGLVFGGSPSAHALYRKEGWTYFSGVKAFVLNRPYDPSPGEGVLRRGAKKILRRLRRRPIFRRAARVSDNVRKDVQVEETEWSDDLLQTDPQAFTLRFAPPISYLRWRYALHLPFVRYRLFRIKRKGEHEGYVVLNDAPTKILVSHCDGKDPRSLAWGILLALLEVARGDVAPRTAQLASSHPGMQEVFLSFGFRPETQERPLAVGSRQGPVDLERDTSRWLVGFDWGDNGLRPPFREPRG